MVERTGLLTHKGRDLTLLGEPRQVGDRAPNAILRAADQSEVELEKWAGKVRLISVVPALDTYICDLQTKRFNEEAAALGHDVVVITISAEHPYNQRRWCGETKVDKIEVLSDHFDMSFGNAYGTWIKEYRLDQRAVFVVDRENRLTYLEYVPEIAQHPDYDAALAAVRLAAQKI
jgi:thiol peroxidase